MWASGGGHPWSESAAPPRSATPFAQQRERRASVGVGEGGEAEGERGRLAPKGLHLQYLILGQGRERVAHRGLGRNASVPQSYTKFSDNFNGTIRILIFF